jgi:hypothetical protein
MPAKDASASFFHADEGYRESRPALLRASKLLADLAKSPAAAGRFSLVIYNGPFRQNYCPHHGISQVFRASRH